MYPSHMIGALFYIDKLPIYDGYRRREGEGDRCEECASEDEEC
jgi:hypothetical protein